MFPLFDLGWTAFFESQVTAAEAAKFVPARVAEQGRGLHRVYAAAGEWLAEPSGRLRFDAASRDVLPVVGDWVLARPRPGELRAVIHRVLDRRSRFARKVAGRKTEVQVLAANVDTVLLVSSLNREFNLRRIERYLTLVWESGARPVVVLNKTDLCDDPAPYRHQAEGVAFGLPVHLTSALTGDGLAALQPYLRPGQTVALLGSSGVGKSTLINALLGEPRLPTRPIREADGRGRHATASRELLLLPGGGLILDTPGLRELQLWESDAGLEHAFADIEALAAACRFADCGHNGEPGCAVARALERADLDPARLRSYHKLRREQAYLERRRDPALQAAEQRRWRQIHKAMRKHPKTRDSA